MGLEPTTVAQPFWAAVGGAPGRPRRARALRRRAGRGELVRRERVPSHQQTGRRVGLDGNLRVTASQGSGAERLYGSELVCMLTEQDILGLYDRLARDLLAYFARRVSSPQAAVDLLANTFLVAFEQRDRCRGSSERERAAWLYRIAASELADHYRREAREQRMLCRLDGELRGLTDREALVIEQLAAPASDLEQQIADAFDGLSDEQREAIRLRVIEERPYAEVSARLGVSEPAARARVSRGLRALGQMMKPNLREGP